MLAKNAGLVVLISEGNARFHERAVHLLAALSATLSRVTAVPGNEPLAKGQHVVALVSFSALGYEPEWADYTAAPVIWVDDSGPMSIPPIKNNGQQVLRAGFTEPELRAALVRALSPRALGELAALAYGLVLVARSEPMSDLLDDVLAFAGSDQTVLIEGETGVGKELIAQLLHHAQAHYSKGPFVAVNCGAIPDGLFESLFFGHTKGAFTGAVQAHKGYLEQANHGTLFLDEIGELPLFQQVKLLRVLETGLMTRVGSELPIQLDFRLVAATNRNLRDMVRQQTFRADLFYRVSVIELQVPNLEQRGPVDKIAIFCMMLKDMLDATLPELQQVPGWLTDRVAGMRFSGNVRQLRNLAERIGVIVRQTGEWNVRLITRAMDLSQDDGTAPVHSEEKPAQAHAQPHAQPDARARILAELEKNGWRREKTAVMLGMSRKSLWEKMRKYGIGDLNGE